MTFWNSKKRLKIPKGQLIRIRIWKKNRQHSGQKKRYKRTNNDQQNITNKTKDRVTRMDRVKNGKLRTYFYNVFKKYIKKKSYLNIDNFQ